MKLRRSHPEWERPYKVPGGDILFILGLFISIWIMIGSMLELPLGGYISLGIYFIIGIALHMVMEFYRKKDPSKHPLITLTPEDKGRMGTL